MNVSAKNAFYDKYEYYVYSLADPRTKNWFLISDPATALIIIGIYLLLIYIILPRHMNKRAPYNLKSIIFYYNVFQILTCSFLIYQIATPFSEPSFAWTCEPFSYSTTPRSLKILNICYYALLLKLTEMIETIFFVLRKKQNQVSKLHNYHLISTFLSGWFFINYYADGTFAVMLNSFVHILMYTYYLLTSLGLYWQKKMLKWKSTLTCLQMLQFCVLIVHASQAFNPSCDVPVIPLIHIPNVAIIFRMFWVFYKNNYFAQSEKKLM